MKSAQAAITSASVALCHPNRPAIEERANESFLSRPFHLVAKERCTSSHPNSFVSLINFAQCGLWLKYSATSSAVASWLPPPPIKEPPCIEYSPNRFLFTQEMSGEVRVVMLS
jgi:hypothetical protein